MPHTHPSSRGRSPSFISSSTCDAPGNARILVAGEIDADAVGRLGCHLQGLLDVRARFITVDATDVTVCDPTLAVLLERAARQLAHRGGRLGVLGLHPDLPTLPPCGGTRPDPHPADTMAGSRS